MPLFCKLAGFQDFLYRIIQFQPWKVLPVNVANITVAMAYM